MEDFQDLPSHLIRRLHQVATALFAEECGEFDVTSVQYATLTAIHSYPHFDATRLSAVLAFDRSTLGDVLERLESKGWVIRGASSFDKRVKRLRLTLEGEILLERVQPAVRRVQARLLARLSPEDQAEMVRLLALLADLHGEAPEPQARSEE